MFFFIETELFLPGGKRGPVYGFMNGSFEMRDRCEEAKTLINRTVVDRLIELIFSLFFED